MGNLCSSLLGGPSEQFHGTLEEQAEGHRRRANQLGDQQRDLSARSQAAYRAGNGALAKQLSNQARSLHTQVDHHNRQAAQLYFQLHNKDAPSGTIDLHGLFVKEALQYLQEAVNKAKREKRKTMTVIVGAGHHSEGGVQRIRPAVEKWCKERGHRFQEINQGCLKVILKEKTSFCCIM